MTTTGTTQHTPGPWTVAASSYQRLPYSVEGNGWTVARVVWDEHFDNPDEEPRANARLIAAAPRMLEALKAYAHVAHIAALLRDIEGA